MTEIIKDEHWGEAFDGTKAMYRLTLAHDEIAEAPYDDGGSPIVRIDYRHGWNARQITEVTSYELNHQIVVAASKWGDDPDMLERYLHIFHGVTKLVWYQPREGGSYMTCDPEHWRENVGAPEGAISLDEWTAYCEGDVYGAVVEKREEWMRVGPDSVSEFRWIEHESLYGLYGYESAKEQAVEFYKETVDDLD